jgi:hypothetical protein
MRNPIAVPRISFLLVKYYFRLLKFLRNSAVPDECIQAGIDVAALFAGQSAASPPPEAFRQAVQADFEITNGAIVRQGRIVAGIAQQILELLNRKSLSVDIRCH